jgi:hypothetical protein
MRYRDLQHGQLYLYREHIETYNMVDCIYIENKETDCI